MKWIIQDWAGNEMIKMGTFDSFEEGWEYLYSRFSNDDDLEEYYVLEREDN